MTHIEPFAAFEDGRALAQAIVDTVREPLLVLDKELRVVAASRSFYETFQADREETQGRAALHTGRRPVGHSGAARAAGEDRARACRCWTATRSSTSFPRSAAAPCCSTRGRFSTRATRIRPCCSPSRTSPSGAQRSGSCSSCCVRRNCCWRRCGIASPTACRSSPAFSC